MNDPKLNRCLVAAAVAVFGLISMRTLCAQEPAEVPIGRSPYEFRGYADATNAARAKAKAILRVTSNQHMMSDIRKAAAALRDAEDGEAKTKAEKNLQDLLSKYFEDDMKQRQAELEEIDTRLSQLRQQLDRRRNKKQEIVDLQAKVLVNEADGLGFFGNHVTSKGIFTPLDEMRISWETPTSPFNVSVEGPHIEAVPGGPVKVEPARPAAPPKPPVPAALPAPTADPAIR